MLDLVAFTKPVLDEITGQDVRTWNSGPSVLAANWQVPEFGSCVWRVRTLTIAFTHDVMNQLAARATQRDRHSQSLSAPCRGSTAPTISWSHA